MYSCTEQKDWHGSIVILEICMHVRYYKQNINFTKQLQQNTSEFIANMK